MRSLRQLRRAAVLPPLVVTLWGWVLVWSSLSSRLDLLLNAAFHPVVAFAGVVLMLVGLMQLRLVGRRRLPVAPVGWLLSALVASLILLLPPQPSFSDLAASRPDSLPAAPSLSFFLPPEQRTLTEWVRLLRSQPDPELHAGDPVRISGFVLDRPGEPLQLARLTVRCCLADATPAGLAVDWPAEANPQADQWFSIEGTMIVQERNGVSISVVKPTQMTLIPRPERPLEP